MDTRWNRFSALIVPVLGAGAVALAIWSVAPRPAAAVDAPPLRPSATYAPSSRFPVVVRTDRFLVMSDADAAWAGEQGEWLERVATIFDDESRAMGFRPRTHAAPLRVMLFAQRDDFVRFAREVDGVDARWMGGYYEPARNRVVAYDDRSSESFRRGAARHAHEAHAEAQRATRAKLAHEAAHLLAFNTGVQVRGVRYPEWFTEGLAERVARAAMGDEHDGAGACTLSGRAMPVSRAAATAGPGAETAGQWALSLWRAAASDDHHARYALWAAAFDALADSRPGAVAELAERLRLADEPPASFATAPLD